MKAEFAIVILNWNGVALLERFLPSVIEYSEDAAIYVIDNGSTDDSLALLANKFSQVTIIALEKNFGFAGGYNLGLAQITEPYLCLLNSDVRVEKGWITDPLRLLKQVKVGIVQPKILDEKRPEFFEYAGAAGGLLDKLGYPYCRGRRFQSVEKDQGQYEEPYSIFWATGACLFIKRSLFNELGGFDADFFAHQEEIDLCWRAQRSGYTVWYTPKSRVYHLGGSTLANSNPFKTELNFRNSLLGLIKNAPVKQLLWVIPIRLVLDGIAGLVFLIEGKPKHTYAILKAHFGFYRMFRKIMGKRTGSYQVSHQRSPLSIVFDYYILQKRK